MLKIRKSKNLQNIEHTYMAIEYDCSRKLVMSVVIKLGKILRTHQFGCTASVG